MTSTSCEQIAQQVLDRCLAGAPDGELPRALLEEPCAAALFRILVEGLADRFEPSLCDVYARLFSQAIAHNVPGLDAASLTARYARVRRVREVEGDPQRVFVLSRITLGADIAVTSVLLDAAQRRFPRAGIVFAGPRKNFELFAGNTRLAHAPVDYPRGGLRQRLSAAHELRSLLSAPDAIVVDPDSRLTQLGLFPVCDEARYYFFESRGYGGASDRALPDLTAEWAERTFGVAGAMPHIALAKQAGFTGRIAVNLGVGENPAKRIPEPFEEQLLALLASGGADLVVDKGGSAGEAERVARAAQRSGASVTFWDGAFAGFADIIAGSRLYVGYDSAGQHVAAACNIPLICVFAGFPSRRMFDRWRPVSDRATVIRVDHPDPSQTLARVQQALERLPAQVVQS